MRLTPQRAAGDEATHGRRVGPGVALGAAALAASRGGDGLRLLWSGAGIPFMRVVGSTPGVIVTEAAGANGRGVGRLRARGPLLSWQAPGSAAEGAGAAVTADGVYLLEDGADRNKWVKVQVFSDFLIPTADALVHIADTYNKMGPRDVTAAQALAGDVTTTAYTLQNFSGNAIVNARLWINSDDADTGNATVSADGVTFVSPASEFDAAALVWPLIAAGAFVGVWMRRTTGAAAASDPKLMHNLEFSWYGY